LVYPTVLVVIIVLSIIMISNWSASRDVIFMTDIKKVGYALERYYEEHHAYPVASNIDLANHLQLSDAGFGSADGTIYYEGSVTSGKARYKSDGQDYTISFTLRRTWSDLGATGRKCTVTAGYSVHCGR
jgi:hypothetical protein